MQVVDPVFLPLTGKLLEGRECVWSVSSFLECSLELDIEVLITVAPD